LYECLNDSEVIVGYSPVYWEAIVWVAEVCELGVRGEEGVDSGCWGLLALVSWERVSSRTLPFPAGLVYGVLGLVFLHGVADDS